MIFEGITEADVHEVARYCGLNGEQVPGLRALVNALASKAVEHARAEGYAACQEDVLAYLGPKPGKYFDDLELAAEGIARNEHVGASKEHG